MDDEPLFLGRLIASVEDGDLALVAVWWVWAGDVAVMTSQVLDAREIQN